MGIKHQRGVALVVALMLTIIIGVIAITLGSISNKTQRSDNANYSKIVSTSNSVSGVNRAINFLVSTTNFKNKWLLDPSYTVKNSDNITIYSADTGDDGVVKSGDVSGSLLKTLFKGVITAVGDSKVDGKTSPQWYTNNNEWKDSENNTVCNLGKCVVLNQGTTTYVIEYRGFQPDSPNSQSLSAKIGYSFYRITSKGLDRPAAGEDNSQLPSSASIIQTNVGIRRSIE